MKYVHGRVRLATASPRVGEYDYGTKTYEPADYYGDHFMYRDDPNLLPVRKGLYASYSPTPSQNALTAYPPQTLYSPHHNSSYNNWSPMSGCHSCNMGYLGSADMDDLAMLEDIQSGEVETIEEEGGGIVEGIANWWNSLSDDDKEFIKNTGREAVDEAVSGGSSSGTGRGKPNSNFQDRLDQMTLAELNEAYKMLKRLPQWMPLTKSMMRQVRAEVVSRLYKNNKPLFTTIIPLQPGSQSKAEKKSGAGGLIIGASVLAILAKALL